MGQPIPAQHPSVVLRSHFKLVRTLLIIAVGAMVALAAAVVILANDDDKVDTASKATPAAQPQTQSAPASRYDGGPEEGTRGLAAERQLPAGTRFDGGPEEGTRVVIASPPAAASRYDGGPEEGSRGPAQVQFKERAGGPTFLHEGR
jgi:hypothetical protein